MMDKEFDNAIKEALTSDEVPEGLNCSLFKKAQGKIKKAKIYTFTKFATAFAAVFICGVCVLSVYNSHNSKGIKQDIVKDNKKEESVEISPKAARSVNDSMPASEATEEKVSDSAVAFNLRKTLTLSDLFNEGYDFKKTINEKIREQISVLPNAGEYKFSGISENVRFSLSEENTLTIIFNEGEITLPTHGEQYFTVGTVANGVLN